MFWQIATHNRPGETLNPVGVAMFDNYYSEKRVLVTGHSGFKGGWLSLWLRELGAEVWGLSLPAPTNPNLHEVIQPGTFSGQMECDIRNFDALRDAVKRTQPEFVFHLAAQPIVRVSYNEPLETIATNVLGTANLLEAVRQNRLSCPVVVVTTDKCYENREWNYAYRENDALGGHDVYSASKACVEIVTQAWHKSFFEPNASLGPVATARAGNVIGGGDYAADRIVPDCIRALMGKKPVLVRNPSAIRPWQHVLECLSGYMWLGARLGSAPKDSSFASAFNFGPEPASRHPVRSVVEAVLKTWPGKWVDGSNPNQPHEAALLTLAIEKAVAMLEWYPVWSFEEGVQQTVAWYYERHAAGNTNMRDYTRGQIQLYTAAARAKGVAWSNAS